MPRWLQILLHITSISTGAYVSIMTGNPIPLVISSAVQTAIGGIAQLYNTDGTPQSVAYIENSNVKSVK